MDIPLGNFTFVPAKDSTNLVAAPVAAALSVLTGSEGVGVCEIDPSLSDTANFCEKYGITPEQAGNCVIVEAKRGEERKLAACVILASTRADVNGKVCDILGMKKASFAPMERQSPNPAWRPALSRQSAFRKAGPSSLIKRSRTRHT